MSKIVDRVRKLLELSKRNDSPQEAAQAAAMAQDLMFKHQIGEADLETAEVRAAEEITEHTIHTYKGRKRCVWKSSLAYAIAKGFGCEMFYMRDPAAMRFQVFGTKSATQTVGYMYGYLALEITRMAEVAWRGARTETRDSAHTWKNNYRLGAVEEIRKRLHEQREEQLAHVREAQAASTTALALYQADEERVRAGFKELSARYRLRSRATSYRSSPSAYQQGRAAGRAVALGGGKGLPASPSRLRS